MSLTRNLRVLAESQPYSFGRAVNFYVRETSEVDGVRQVAYARPLCFDARGPENEGVCASPAFSLGRDEAQQFMDQLWEVGLRPSEGSGSAGALAATQRHLDDMRALVFKTGAPGGGK